MNEPYRLRYANQIVGAFLLVVLLIAMVLAVLLLRAEMDDVLTEPHQSEVIANNLKNTALLTYRTIKNAGHYSFITPFPEAVKSETGVVAEDPEGFDREEFHKTLGSAIAAYLLDVLQ